jgi:Cdc6-like AAA superfamily ATPase
MSESEDTDIIPAPTSIVHAPTDITTVNSSLAKTAIPNQDNLAKVTYYKLDLDTILDGLIPDPLPESGGRDNAIHHLNIIIFGKPNTGKTTLAESIAQALARRYGQRNVRHCARRETFQGYSRISTSSSADSENRRRPYSCLRTT